MVKNTLSDVEIHASDSVASGRLDMHRHCIFIALGSGTHFGPARLRFRRYNTLGWTRPWEGGFGVFHIGREARSRLVSQRDEPRRSPSLKARRG
jgi:hypothetical protein